MRQFPTAQLDGSEEDRGGPNEGRGGLACGTHVVHRYGRGTLLRVCVGPVRPVGGLYRDFL